jgi:hypothetical protein
MGVFADIVDVIKSTELSDTVNKIKKYKKPKSIAQLASEGTMQFPVIVTRSLDIDTLQMVTKALERNYSTFVEIAITMNGVMSSSSSIQDFLQIYHQNSDIDKDAIEKFFTESYNIYSNENMILLSGIYEGSDSVLTEDNRNQLFDLREHVNTDILNNKFTPRANVIYNTPNLELNKRLNSVLEADIDFPEFDPDKQQLDYEIKRAQFEFNKKRDYERHNEEQGRIKAKEYENELRKRELDIKEEKSKADNKRKDDIAQNNFEETQRHNKERLKLDQSTAEITRLKYELEKGKYVTRFNDAELAKNVLVDNDVKKANELISTTMHIKLKQIDSDGKYDGIVDFIMGVKCTMHPVKSADMIINLVKACVNSDTVFNIIRWTTGEIGFFKDLILNITNTKADVANMGNGSSEWWLALKRRKALASLKNKLPFTKKLMPNATIVCSMEEVEMIKSRYGFDLMNDMFVKKIMMEYFLLGFVIVDDASQIVHFRFDSDKHFQSVSYSGLERENSSNERKFKEMLKVINRN